MINTLFLLALGDDMRARVRWSDAGARVTRVSATTLYDVMTTSRDPHIPHLYYIYTGTGPDPAR